MASGFIILRDGSCLRLRWALYDWTLRSIANSLGPADQLKAWLATQVSQDNDIEFGYAFQRATDGETVGRTLDTRGLTELNRRLFELAARQSEPIGGQYAPVEDVAKALKSLRELLDRCDGRPSLEFSDWKIEAPPCKERIGPGWPSSN